jgi:hypothetical protein
MWNTGLNGSCWYQGAGCSGEAVCEYINSPLPVELIEFKGEKEGLNNILTWSTASESNSSWFRLYHFTGTGDTIDIITLPGAGNTTTLIDYKATHINPPKEVNYYFLIQGDFDGRQEAFTTIAIDNRVKESKELKRTNLLGQEIGPSYRGIVIIVYTDGTTSMDYLK